MFRLTAAAGFLCAVVLAFNTARRAGVLPETALTHAIAPLAPLAGLFAITGCYFLISRTAGRLGLIGFTLNAAGLAGAFAVEYTLHFVFPALGRSTVATLVAGGTGRAFLVTSLVLMAGVLTFAAAAIRAGGLPTGAIVLYAAGMIPGSLRNVVPEPLYLLGLLVAAAGVAWLALGLWRAEPARATLAQA
ncbi:hypothetical protein ACIBHY_36660 [Nonomuraea sp. NPDC050547]|uniref:hypothetical protein n=1 Tax=unclassified Nonomuraea TaxID=2593643 RepID=UPI00379C473A